MSDPRSFWQSRMTTGGKVPSLPELTDLSQLAADIRAYHLSVFQRFELIMRSAAKARARWPIVSHAEWFGEGGRFYRISVGGVYRNGYRVLRIVSGETCIITFDRGPKTPREELPLRLFRELIEWATH